MKEECFLTGIVGTGRIGFSLGFDKKREQPASHTMALFSNKKIKLIAAADSNLENLKNWQKFSKKHNPQVQIFSTSEELYKKISGIDIITVAVNEENHLSECIKAIECRPHLVILEKPVALNSSEAEKIQKKASELNVPVMVNHERRFAKDYLAVQKLIPQIGEIQNVTAELDSGLRIYGEKFEKDGTYSLLHDGTHLVNIISFLFARQNSSQSPFLKNPLVTGVYKDEKNIVRNFTANYTDVQSKYGMIPQITLKMSGRSKFFEFRIEILGTLGKIIIGNGIFDFYLRKESKLYSGFYSLTRQKVNLPKKTGYFSGMIQNAVDFLDGTSELVSPLEDAILDLKILEEIKKNF